MKRNADENIRWRKGRNEKWWKPSRMKIDKLSGRQIFARCLKEWKGKHKDGRVN